MIVRTAHAADDMLKFAFRPLFVAPNHEPTLDLPCASKTTDCCCVPIVAGFSNRVVRSCVVRNVACRRPEQPSCFATFLRASSSSSSFRVDYGSGIKMPRRRWQPEPIKFWPRPAFGEAQSEIYLLLDPIRTCIESSASSAKECVRVDRENIFSLSAGTRNKKRCYLEKRKFIAHEIISKRRKWKREFEFAIR